MSEDQTENNLENQPLTQIAKPRRKTKLIYWIIGSMALFGLGFGAYYAGTQTNSSKITQPKPSGIETQPQVEQVETVKISGKVVNKITEEPIAGAKVLGDSQTITDESGSFNMDIPKLNPKDISVSAEGFIAVTAKPADGATISLVPQGRVAFVSNKAGGKRGVYTVNYDGSQEKALIERVGEKEDFNAVVSPRNRYVAFLSTRNERKNRYGSDDPALYLVKVDGSGLTKISDFYSISNIGWSPDGTYLAWAGREKDEDNNTKIAVRDIDRGTTTYSGDPGEYLSYYSFAPDDSRMTFYVYSNQSNPSRKGTYVAEGNGSNPKKISDIATSGAFNDDNNLEFSEYKDNKTHFYVWFHDSNAVKEVAKRDDSKRAGVKSPDKNWVAYIANRDGKSNVFVSKPDKSEEKQLTQVDSAQGTPRFTPDGKYIIIDVYKTGESAKYIVSSQGKGKAQKIIDQITSGMGEYY